MWKGKRLAGHMGVESFRGSGAVLRLSMGGVNKGDGKQDVLGPRKK